MACQKSAKTSLCEGLLVGVIIVSFIVYPTKSECQCFPPEQPLRCCEFECNGGECERITELLACIFTLDKNSQECQQVVSCQDECGEGLIGNAFQCDAEEDICYGCNDNSTGNTQDICNNDTLWCLWSGTLNSPPCRRIRINRYACRPNPDLCLPEGEPAATKEQTSLPTILVPAIVCITVVLLIILATVILSRYWRYRIKVIHERRQNTTIDMTTDCTVEPPQAYYLYSELGGSASPQAPALPPDRIPYYQEIQSDIVLAADYEEPTLSINNMQITYDPGTKMEADDEKKDRVQTYEEPAEALKYVDVKEALKDEDEKNF